MKLLILTQKVDKKDPILGFFHKWLEEFSQNVKKVTVIALSVGTYDLPINVSVLSLGKERGFSRFKILTTFYKYIYQYRKDYDHIFVHMNPEYVVLAGLFWRLSGKKIVLWYTHRQTNLKLWLAEKLAHTIFTVSKESFNLSSKKVKVMGHGIDTNIFSYAPLNLETPRVVTFVGRITSIKCIETFIEAMNRLEQKFPHQYTGRVVGDAIDAKDKRYKDSLPTGVNFLPSVPQSSLPEIYRESFATVNMSPTGGMDKVVLESLAMGRPAFASNRAFADVFGEYRGNLLFPQGNSEALARAIEDFTNRNDKKEVCRELAQKMHDEYGVTNLVKRICQSL